MKLLIYVQMSGVNYRISLLEWFHSTLISNILESDWHLNGIFQAAVLRLYFLIISLPKQSVPTLL